MSGRVCVRKTGEVAVTATLTRSAGSQAPGQEVRRVRSMVVVVAVLSVVGCDADRARKTAPTAPSPAQPTANPGATRAYLDALLGTMETYSVNKATIDWTNLRTEVVSSAGDAQIISDLYPAIGVGLRVLGDQESYYQARDGTLVGPPPMGGCGALAPATQGLPATIGYVKVASCDCQGSAATQFAESIQRAIRTADRVGLAGWIVDLRGNFGGNMWPMIAGIGPVLGEGIIGWIVYNDREYEREYRDGAATSFGDVFARVAAPYTLLNEYPKVAVLTDGIVASSGEAIVVFFKGRPRTRSFGIPTCGHHHLQQAFPLSDGATLFLVSGQHADRTKRRYGGPIDPDEMIVDPREAINRAIAWLLGVG
jgi:carboxyl-terminal processing protease